MTTISPDMTPASDLTLARAFQKPVKQILSSTHLAAFQRSATHQELLSFITDLNESIVGKKLSDAGEGSEVCMN